MSKKNVGTSDGDGNDARSHTESGAQKLSKGQKIMIGGFTCVIIVIVAAAAVIFSILSKPKPEPAKGNLVVNQDNVSQITNDIEAEVADGMFMTDMNVDWSFPNGKSASVDAYVGNSISNHRPISFDVVLSDTGEVIYTSDVIPTGYTIKEIKFDTSLSAGTYAAVCNYHLLDEETGDVVSSVGINITLRILG